MAEVAIAEAIACLSRGAIEDATRCLDGLDPAALTSVVHCNLIGRVFATAGHDVRALPWFDRTLALDASFGEALLGRAAALARLDRHGEAATAFAAVLARDGANPDTFYASGTALRLDGRPHEALAAYDAALILRPAFPEARRAAAAVLRDLGHLPGALRLLTDALTLRPDYLDASLDLANLLHAEDRVTEALAQYDGALTHAPTNALLWNNRAMALHDLGRMEAARDSLDEALRLDPKLPQAHHNRGNVLFRLGLFADAVAASEAALALRPDYVEALTSRGLALKMLGRFDDARASFEAALRLDPASIYAKANRGDLKLLLGDFATGWPDYEWRFFTERQAKPVLPTPAPEWAGQHAPGATVAVFADQGNGDTLQFARFLPALAAQGVAVTFICPARLHRVLAPVTSGMFVREKVEANEGFDYQIALSSLPGALRTDLATLAKSRPYLAAEPDRVEHWRERIGSSDLRIGLCWRGSQNWQCDPRRSIPVELFAPLAALPGVRLISLQLADAATPETMLQDLGLAMLGDDFDAGPDAFVDTAAVMANLDLVVTVDTSITHLAGALGRPVWTLLQAVPEWRWMLGIETSPWYPGMRLFRQATMGDWTDPIQRVVEAARRETVHRPTAL